MVSAQGKGTLPGPDGDRWDGERMIVTGGMVGRPTWYVTEMYFRPTVHSLMFYFYFFSWAEPLTLMCRLMTELFVRNENGRQDDRGRASHRPGQYNNKNNLLFFFFSGRGKKLAQIVPHCLWTVRERARPSLASVGISNFNLYLKHVTVLRWILAVHSALKWISIWNIYTFISVDKHFVRVWTSE